MNLGGDGLRHALRPGLQKDLGCLIRQFLRAEKAAQSGGEDKEGKQRSQGGQGDMARNGPAIVRKETIIGVEKNRDPFAHAPRPASGFI